MGSKDALRLRTASALEQRGVLVRWFDKPGVRDCARVSVGTPDHTARLCEALEREDEPALRQLVEEAIKQRREVCG